MKYSHLGKKNVFKYLVYRIFPVKEQLNNEKQCALLAFTLVDKNFHW